MSYLPTRFLVWPVIFLVGFFFFQNFRLTGLGHVGIELRPASSPVTTGFTRNENLPSGSGFQRPDSYALVNTPARLDGNSPSAIRTATPQSIRVGSFYLDSFGQGLESRAAQTLASLLASFDIIALQGINEVTMPALAAVVDSMNQSSNAFELMVGPMVGPSGAREQFAFVYNNATVESDRAQLYSVDDPQDLVMIEPLVGWFRARSVHPNSGFSLTLINGRIAANRLSVELPLLPELVRSVQMDGRREDDCLLVGDFGIGSNEMNFLNASGLSLLVAPLDFTTNGAAFIGQDNIAIPVSTAREYTGRSGRLDFLRHYNLSREESEQLSRRMPVWADFLSFEGVAG